MRRRGFVSGVVTVALGALAGCLGGSESGNNTTGKKAPTSEESPTSDHLTTNPAERTNSGETQLTDTETIQTTIDSPGYTRNGDIVGESENWSAKNNPQSTVTVGDRSRLPRGDMPHSVLVWNDDTSTRVIRTNLVPGDSPKQDNFQRSFHVKPDSYVALKLARYRSYLVSVGVNERNMKYVAKITPEMIDCNTSVTYIAVRTDGSVDAVTAATSMLCGPPRTTTN